MIKEKAKFTIDDIKIIFAEYNFSVVSTKYNPKEKTEIICNICGALDSAKIDSFKKRAVKCRTCFGIEKLKIAENILNKINYKLISKEYNGTKTKYNIVCDKEHEFSSLYDNILKGNKCPKCDTQNRIKKQTLKYEDIKSFIEKAKYTLLSAKYVSSKDLLLVKCPKGHEYAVTYGNFYMGKRCLRCKESKGEVAVAKYLESKNIKYIKNKRYKNCKYKYTLPFDFYLQDLDVLIEYDGIQHFEVRGTFGEESFIETILRDSIKNSYCEDNNIKLIRIPYWEYDNINDFLDKKLKCFK